MEEEFCNLNCSMWTQLASNQAFTLKMDDLTGFIQMWNCCIPKTSLSQSWWDVFRSTTEISEKPNQPLALPLKTLTSPKRAWTTFVHKHHGKLRRLSLLPEIIPIIPPLPTPGSRSRATSASDLQEDDGLCTRPCTCQQKTPFPWRGQELVLMVTSQWFWALVFSPLL